MIFPALLSFPSLLCCSPSPWLLCHCSVLSWSSSHTLTDRLWASLRRRQGSRHPPFPLLLFKKWLGWVKWALDLHLSPDSECFVYWTFPPGLARYHKSPVTCSHFFLSFHGHCFSILSMSSLSTWFHKLETWSYCWLLSLLYPLYARIKTILQQESSDLTFWDLFKCSPGDSTFEASQDCVCWFIMACRHSAWYRIDVW